MNISRKEFFKKSLLSVGEAVSAVRDALNAPPAEEIHEQPEEEFVPHVRDDQVAVARNEHCLAKNCGCFACFERCETKALLMVMGQGIRIDSTRCTGCGTCEYVCPSTPKAVGLELRK